MLAHPRTADLGLDPFLRLGVGKTENEKRVSLIDFDKTTLAAGFADHAHDFLRSVDHRFGNRLLEAQVVDGDANQSILSLQSATDFRSQQLRAEDVPPPRSHGSSRTNPRESALHAGGGAEKACKRTRAVDRLPTRGVVAGFYGCPRCQRSDIAPGISSTT